MLDALPDALSTPELNVAVRRRRAACADREDGGDARRFPGATEVIRIDGLRVEYADGFGLARASNTTPVIVLRFEADNAAALARIQDEFRARARARQARRRAALLTMADSLTLADIEAARERIAGGIYVSPCVESIPLSQLTGAHVFCKLDYLQRTGSFKERGARNALLLLTDEQRKRGVIAASAGNHAQGVAYHGSLLGIPGHRGDAEVRGADQGHQLPRISAPTSSCTAPTWARRARSRRRSRSAKGLTFIHPFDNADVMAGQGTMALEILEQTPDVEAIVVPVGGGGLLAGIGTVVQGAAPAGRASSASSPNTPPASPRRARPGIRCPCTLSPTLADGLAVPLLGKLPFADAASASSTRS